MIASKVFHEVWAVVPGEKYAEIKSLINEHKLASVGIILYYGNGEFEELKEAETMPVRSIDYAKIEIID